MELQDVSIEVANEQEPEKCMQEEVVSDITLPEYIEFMKIYIQM